MSVLKWLLKTAAVTALLFAAFVLPVLLWIYAPAYLALFFLFSACAAILFGAYIVSRAMPPEYKISWMFPALIAPFLGGALFLFFGNSRFGLKNDRSYTKKSLGLDAYLPAPAQGDGLFFEAAETIFCETGYPAARGDVSYYATGERFFDALLSAIEGAKHYVFLEFFIAKKGVLWDRLERILLCKAKEQTEIRLVLDDMGCLGGIRRRDCEALERAGVRIHYFNPVFRLDGVNNRTHRKLAVIDGQEGFLCGANIADEYIKGYGKFGYWKDTGVSVKGACVANLTAMFLQIWAMRYGQEAYRGYFPEMPAGSGEVLLFSDSPVQSNAAAEHLYLALVRSAKKEVVFSTPYLLLDEKLLSALSGAVKRGIMVRAILPAIPDKAAIYALTKQNAERLMSFGAEVYIYTPGFNHAKMFAVDGRYAVVGTTNMDFRSFYLHFECNAFFGGEAAKAVCRDLTEMTADSERARIRDFAAGGLGKLGRGLLQIIQPLM